MIGERDRLLTLLETEQQARRDLETKLLPAPKPALVGKVECGYCWPCWRRCCIRRLVVSRRDRFCAGS